MLHHTTSTSYRLATWTLACLVFATTVAQETTETNTFETTDVDDGFTEYYYDSTFDNEVDEEGEYDDGFEEGHVDNENCECLIEGKCWHAGDANPDNSCKICNPKRNFWSWSKDQSQCLIAGGCFKDGTAHTSDPCKICNSTKQEWDWSVDESWCYIEMQCFEAGDTSPIDENAVCDPSNSQYWWTIERYNVTDECACKLAGLTCIKQGEERTRYPCFHCDPFKNKDWYSLKEGMCFINGRCYDGGEQHEFSSCQICDSERDPYAWSIDVSDPTCEEVQSICDCHIDGVCYEEDALRPGRPCYSCKSDHQKFWWTLEGCDIAEVCYEEFEENPDNYCQMCDPYFQQYWWRNDPLCSELEDYRDEEE